jgi:hypothetical protein
MNVYETIAQKFVLVFANNHVFYFVDLINKLNLFFIVLVT